MESKSDPQTQTPELVGRYCDHFQCTAYATIHRVRLRVERNGVQNVLHSYYCDVHLPSLPDHVVINTRD